MGIDAKSNKMIVLWRVRETIVKFLDPKAWLQSGSIPMARPKSTEYPVILVKPMANAPPASSKLPSLPMHATEIMFFSAKNLGDELMSITNLQHAFVKLMMRRIYS